MRTIICAAAVLLSCAGCQSWSTNPPVEAFANRFFDTVESGVKAGVQNGIDSLQIQAGAQVVNPKYIVKFDGKWVVGIEGSVSVGVDGLAGQAQVSTIAAKPKLEVTTTATPVNP